MRPVKPHAGGAQANQSGIDSIQSACREASAKIKLYFAAAFGPGKFRPEHFQTYLGLAKRRSEALTRAVEI